MEFSIQAHLDFLHSLQADKALTRFAVCLALRIANVVGAKIKPIAFVRLEAIPFIPDIERIRAEVPVAAEPPWVSFCIFVVLEQISDFVNS